MLLSTCAKLNLWSISLLPYSVSQCLRFANSSEVPDDVYSGARDIHFRPQPDAKSSAKVQSILIDDHFFLSRYLTLT